MSRGPEGDREPLSSTTFQRLGSIPASRLIEARLELHFAAQALAAAGASLVPVRPDDSHTSLTFWAGALHTEALAGTALRAKLRIPELDLSIDDHAGTAPIVLAGLTLDQTLERLRDALATALDRPVAQLARPGYEMPSHALGTGARFGTPDAAALAELERWFANAAIVLEGIRARTPGAGPVRCWPHHFDIATLIALGESKKGAARSVGVGMSPGDAAYPEPYFYIAPWPRPKGVDLPDLPSGAHWHSEGFFAAVLTKDALTSAPSGLEQRRRLDAFFGTTIPAAKALAGRGARA